MRLGGPVDVFADVGAKLLDIRPGARSLERLGDDVVLHREVPQIRNHVRQLVALDAILSTAGKAAVL